MGRAGRRGGIDDAGGGESKREPPYHASTSSSSSSDVMAAATSPESSSSSSSLPLPLRYHHPPTGPHRQQQGYGATTYQSLETAAATAATATDGGDDGPTVSFTGRGGLSPFFGGRARRALAPAGLLLHGSALVAVGLLCGLGVGVLIGRGGGGAGADDMGAALVARVGGAGAAGLPVLGNSFSPQVRRCGWVGGWVHDSMGSIIASVHPPTYIDTNNTN